MFHKRLGHSEKLTKLTDLEYIVWGCFVLSADDFGVMRFSAHTLRSDHDRLAHRPTRMIERALLASIEVGLLLDFEHQARRYVCQLDWQDFQKIEHPTRSYQPIPPEPVFQRCSEKTQALFRRHVSYGLPPNLHPVGDKSPNDSQTFDAYARAPGREEANGLRLMANGSRQDMATTSGVVERFARFWAVYPRKVGKEAARKVWAKLKPSEELVLQMLAVLAWQRQQDDWLKEGGQFVPYPASWLNQGRWEDEPREGVAVSGRTLAISRAAQEFLKS